MAFTPNGTLDGQPVEMRYVEKPSWFEAVGDPVPDESYEYATMFHATYEDGNTEYVSWDDLDEDDDEDED